MSHIDHHSKPYDEGTLNKLEIFSRYIESWLPTFIMQPHINEVNIVDFFAGLGYDSTGKSGAPILILEKIDGFFGYLMTRQTIINLYVNEFNTHKFNKLVENCDAFLDKNKRLRKFVKIHYFNEDFNVIYHKIISTTHNQPNLFLIDQNGIKFTNQENFNTLLNLKTTDFLFFISSSFFKRFNKEEEFSKHLHRIHPTNYTRYFLGESCKFCGNRSASLFTG
ncbi:MAG: three-Cys-motif partner protein TcmP [Bacteroidales bacterium]|jgi:three-Cys-motif partner protein|nr:three-Cys-motif partner protein TcmP [Bacteroidales bacterium]